LFCLCVQTWAAVHDTVTDRQRGCGAQTSMPANVCLRPDDQDEKGMGGAEIYIASAYTWYHVTSSFSTKRILSDLQMYNRV
jgi:hypothetical protein